MTWEIAFVLGLTIVAVVLFVTEKFSTDVVAVLVRSEEHTSELQSLVNLVCRLLLEKKKITTTTTIIIITRECNCN